MKFIEFQTNLLVKERKMYKCQVCSYSTNRSYNLRRHEKFNHKDSEPIEHMSNVYFSHQPTNTVSSTNPNDIRLKENFKIFISGPSRCFCI